MLLSHFVLFVRRKRIELLSPAWKAGILPLNQHRVCDYTTIFCKIILELYIQTFLAYFPYEKTNHDDKNEKWYHCRENTCHPLS